MNVFEYIRQEKQYYETNHLYNNYYVEKFLTSEEARNLAYVHKEKLMELLSRTEKAINHINYLISNLNLTIGTTSTNGTVYPFVYSKYNYSLITDIPACNSNHCKNYFNILIDLKAIYLRFIDDLKDIINANNVLIKGYIGENKIIKKLSLVEGAKLHNVYLEFEGELECEIDHLLVNQHGVFIIETKNWAGHITVDSDGTTLKGKTEKDKKRVDKNPIDQINRCAMSLDKFIRYYCTDISDISVPIHTIVVFADDESRLECKRGVGLTKIVLVDTLFESIREIEQEFKYVINESAQNHILTKINEHNTKDRKWKFKDFIEPLRIPDINYAYNIEEEFFSSVIQEEDIMLLRRKHIFLYYIRTVLKYLENNVLLKRIKFLKEDKNNLTRLFDRFFLNNKRNSDRNKSQLKKWIPVVLSIVPGLGQFYNGQRAKALLFFLLFIILTPSRHPVIGYFICLFYFYNFYDAYNNSRHN